MDVQHLNVKIFTDNPETVALEKFVGVFNGWIQNRAADELLIDVADYRHVPAGPGVVLVGHEANYSLDNVGNRLGLLYSRKARVDGPPRERLRQAVRAALVACDRLEHEQGLKFEGGETQLILNDRLLAPNSPETFTALESELHAFFAVLYGGAEYALARNSDPRERFTVSVKANRRFDVRALLKNL